jgi:hypothetical protein
MSIKRTPQIKEAMTNALRTAIEYLSHPDMPTLPHGEHPTRLANFLETDIGLINHPGRIPEKKYVLGDIQLAADYLSNPKVTRIPFAIRSSNIARALQEVIRDLK